VCRRRRFLEGFDRQVRWRRSTRSSMALSTGRRATCPTSATSCRVSRPELIICTSYGTDYHETPHTKGSTSRRGGSANTRRGQGGQIQVSNGASSDEEASQALESLCKSAE
jgi:hypothetical protein